MNIVCCILVLCLEYFLDGLYLFTYDCSTYDDFTLILIDFCISFTYMIKLFESYVRDSYQK